MQEQRRGVKSMANYWTMDEKALAVELLNKNYSARQIAAQLNGRTKNSVIGLLNRMGLHWPTVKPKLKRASKDNPRKLTHTPQNMKANLEYKRMVDPVTRPSGGVPYFSIRNFECRYITFHAERIEQTLFCGDPTKGLTSWCVKHHAIVFRPKDTPRGAFSGKEVRF